MHKVHHWILIVLAAGGGAALMVITSLFAVECTMGEPGGVNEGGRGFPIPYYSCGVWGESFSWTIAVIDFIILSLATYLMLKLIIKFIQKR